MPIWRLTPIPAHLGDVAWQNSRYTGVVLVRAADEPHARRLVSRRFQGPVELRLGHPTSWNPWIYASFVTCTPEGGSIYDAEGPDAVLWPEEDAS